MRSLKRFLSAILIFALVLSLLPSLAAPQAKAATGYDLGYAGGMAGTGTILAHGVDISEHQGSGFNFQNLVDNGYTYVILRCGFYKRMDYCFEEYYAAAKAVGLNVGTYFYSYAATAEEAAAEADLCLSYIAGKTFEYPVYFDFEDSTAGGVGGSGAYDICMAFMDKIAAAGYLTGLYSYAAWIDPNYYAWVPVDSICSRYECWIANYYDGTYTSNPRGGNYSTTYGMWQYTDSNYIGGVGPLDTNVCYKDYPTIVKTYGFNGYSSGKSPVGYVDGVSVVGPGKLRVRGWTLDEDELTTPLEVHVYVGGGPGDGNAEGHIIMANQLREDIGIAYPGAGSYHGFDVILNTGKSGDQVVNIFGINVRGGSNTLLNNSGVTVNIPPDTENPVITNAQVSGLSSYGYTVTCTVSDNVAIQKVTMPTWTEEGGQDDIIWGEASVSGNTATLNISFSSHNFEYGTYHTHIYAYDLAGNMVNYPLVIDVPPVLAEEPVTGTVGQNNYFIASALNRNYVVDVAAGSTDNGANVQLWYTLGIAKNQMWQLSDADGDGYYTIISLHSGKALDAADGGTTDGTNVQQYETNGTDAQLWKLVENDDGTYCILNKLSGLALDLFYGVLSNGQNIQLYTANQSAAQKWYLIPADLTGPEITDVVFSEVTSEGFRITCTVNDLSGIEKLEFPAWTSYNGTDDQKWHAATLSGNTATCYIPITDHNKEPGYYEIHIYAYDKLGNSSGVPTFGVDVPNRIGNTAVDGTVVNGTYFITTSQNQNYVVDVEGVSTENGANVYLWETLGINTNQMWQIVDADGDGYYTVAALHSGKYLDVAGGLVVSDTNVQQYEATNSDAQLWSIVPNGDGTYCLYSKCGGFALDLYYGLVADGVNIRIHDVNGAAAQKWYLIPAKLSADTAHTHTYLSHVVTEPTCTAVGFTTHICDNCGASYTDSEIAATGHSHNYSNNGADHTVTCANCDYSVTEPHTYEDGTCLCGAVEITEPTQVNVKLSHTVSFDSDLQMNYRIKYENIAAAVPNYVTEGAYLVVEKDRYPMGGGEKTVETVTLYPDLTSEPDRMLFSLKGIQSVEMGSELRVVLHFFDAAGREYYTQIDTYSVLAYAQLCYDSYTYDEKPRLYTLLIDTLNYGAAAQEAFDRRADEPVNAGMEAYQQYATTELSAELSDSRTYVDNERSITAVSAVGFTVTFADKTELNAKLTIAEGYTKADITSVKVLNESGEEVAILNDFTELDDGRLQVTFTGIKSVNMRDMYYFVVYVGEEVASQNVGYSVEAYVKSNINSGDAALAALARACIYYGDSAKACFAN